MKRNLIYLIAPLLFILNGCNNLLDSVQPIGQSTENEQFATAEGAEQILLGCYDNQSLYELDINIIDCYGDLGMGLSTAANDWHSALQGLIQPSSIQNQIWQRYYFQIAKCNDFIRNVNKYTTPFNPESRKQEALAEARAIRAFAYFMLVQCYGDVPLMTEENFSELYPPRSPVSSIYAQIISDLEFAGEKLSENYPVGILSGTDVPESGRVIRYATVAMLAKVLMTAPEGINNYTRASELLDKVINESGYKLLSNWSNVFNPEYRSNNPENVWPIMFTNEFQGGGSKLAHYSTFDQTWMRPKSWFYEFYDESDDRRDNTIERIIRRIIVDGKFAFDTVQLLNKYTQGLSGDERDNHPYYVMRYPEVLLLKAEVSARLNFEGNKTTAIEYLNKVRDRANAVPAIESDFPDQSSFYTALMDEYHKEFYFEFNTWLTFKRFGMERTFQRQGIPYTESNFYKFLLPLPTQELIRNPSLLQNPGYPTE